MTMRRMALPGSPKKDNAAAGLAAVAGGSGLVRGAETSAAGVVRSPRVLLTVSGAGTGAGGRAGACAEATTAEVAAGEIGTREGAGKPAGSAIAGGTAGVGSAPCIEADTSGLFGVVEEFSSAQRWLVGVAAALACAVEPAVPGRNLSG